MIALAHYAVGTSPDLALAHWLHAVATGPAIYLALVFAAASYYFDGVSTRTSRLVLGALFGLIAAIVGTQTAYAVIVVPVDICSDPANVSYWVWVLYCVILP